MDFGEWQTSNPPDGTLIFPNGVIFESWPDVQAEDQTKSAILDGEIVCLGAAGKLNFDAPLFRRTLPCFYTLEVAAGGGEDIRTAALAAQAAARTDRASEGGPPLEVEHLITRGVESLSLSGSKICRESSPSGRMGAMRRMAPPPAR